MASQLVQEKTLADRLFGWWYYIAAPPAVPDDAPLRQRMIVRSGRLTSVIFLIECVIDIINLVIALIVSPYVVVAVLLVLAALVTGIVLNRNGKITLAGIIVFTTIEVGLILDFVSTPGGLSMYALSSFDFFITGELIAVSLLVPWIAFPVTAMNCIIMVSLIIFVPKTPEVVYLLHTQGYSIFADPISVQVMVSIVTYLWVSSAFNDMKRANSAEEVNKLTMQMAMGQQQAEEEKEQLEQSIQQIIEVHMQVANGNFDARVPLDKQNVLWSVAGSLNNLLARLQRLRHDSIQVQRNEQALEQLLNNVQKFRRLGTAMPVYKTGTSLDALIMEIAKGMPAPQKQQDDPLTKYPSMGD